MRKLRPGKIKYTARNYSDCKGQSTVSNLGFWISESPAPKSGGSATREIWGALWTNWGMWDLPPQHSIGPCGGGGP